MEFMDTMEFYRIMPTHLLGEKWMQVNLHH